MPRHATCTVAPRPSLRLGPRAGITTAGGITAIIRSAVSRTHLDRERISRNGFLRQLLLQQRCRVGDGL